MCLGLDLQVKCASCCPSKVDTAHLAFGHEEKFLHEEQPYFVEEEEPVMHSLDVTLDSALPRNAQKGLWQVFSKSTNQYLQRKATTESILAGICTWLVFFDVPAGNVSHQGRNHLVRRARKHTEAHPRLLHALKRLAV